MNIDPVSDPKIKLFPIIKLMGKLIVSKNKKFILVLLLLFWIPIIIIRNTNEFNKIIKLNFFIESYI